MKQHAAADAYRDLARALAGLAPDQGRLARRNARARVRAAVRRILKAVDTSYPTIRKPVRERGRRPWSGPGLSPSQRASRWHRYHVTRGYQEASLDEIRAMAEVGVRPLASPRNDYVGVLMPPWVVAASALSFHKGTGFDRNEFVQRLREGKRSVQAKRAIMAEAALRRSGS